MDHWKPNRFKGKNHPMILRNIFPGMSAIILTSYSPLCIGEVSKALPQAFLYFPLKIFHQYYNDFTFPTETTTTRRHGKEHNFGGSKS